MYVSQMIFIKNIFTFLHVRRNKIQPSFFFCQINSFKHIMAFLKKSFNKSSAYLWHIFEKQSMQFYDSLKKSYEKLRQLTWEYL